MICNVQYFFMGIGPPWQMSYQNTDSSHGPILGAAQNRVPIKINNPILIK
jgi:hypothetical protein